MRRPTIDIFREFLLCLVRDCPIESDIGSPGGSRLCEHRQSRGLSRPGEGSDFQRTATTELVDGGALFLRRLVGHLHPSSERVSRGVNSSRFYTGMLATALIMARHGFRAKKDRLWWCAPTWLVLFLITNFIGNNAPTLRPPRVR
jgi:hypothetical protein